MFSRAIVKNAESLPEGLNLPQQILQQLIVWLKGLAGLFETGNARKVQPKHAKRPNLILTALNAATQAAQMAMPGMRFHPLHGDRYSVWVDKNYRVTFRFDDGHAYEVHYEDYH